MCRPPRERGRSACRRPRPPPALPFPSSSTYAWGKFRARADYRFRSAYTEGLDNNTINDEWFSAREQVDAEIGYDLGKNLRLFATGTNLTHPPQVSYTGGPESPEDISSSVRKFSFGVDDSF